VSDEGARNADKVMSYKLTPTSETLRLAWGPPFVPADAEKLLTEIAGEITGVQNA